MKLQNLSVIFIIIILPIILVLAYYMSLQADTLNMQTAYNTKLLDSTKEAIDAFEINTVEWNANYSETADSKRRDVMASINTFTNSFANNLGVSGTSREYILANVPAIAFTLYDGYYIYSPAKTRLTVKNSNEVTVFYTKELIDNGTITGTTYEKDNKNKILYMPAVDESGNYKDVDGYYNGEAFTLEIDNAATEYKHILKPFTSYSEKVTATATTPNTEVVINYTLDNYITLYGKMKDTDDEVKYVSRGGYLTDTAKIEGVKDTDKTIENIKFDGKDIEPEILSEEIAYKNGDTTTGVFNYVYEAEGNTKVYIEEVGVTKKFFRLDSDLEKVYVEDLTEPLYKKCTIPRRIGGKTTYIEIYQKLTTEDNKWYTINNNGEYVEFSIDGYSGVSTDVKLDYSAINYCVESYVFTQWVNGLGLVSEDGTTLNINSTNDPESDDSAFTNHKREVIKYVVEANLNQAITSYSRNSNNGNYYLPKLTETDWDQILTNVSIVTFVQNIPIGLKEYNNYAIATSTVNKEYVDPNEIYLYDENNDTHEYYHTPYCEELSETKLIGYRSIDFMQKSYEMEDKSIKYYYKHEDDVTQSCYNCLVQGDLYEDDSTSVKKKKTYYTALARERYVARMTKLPAEIEATVRIAVETYDPAIGGIAPSTKFKIGDTEFFERDSIVIPKNTLSGTRYDIQAQVEGNIIGDEDIADSLGGLDEGDRNATSSSEPSSFVTYESSAKATVIVDEYKDDSFKFDVVDINDISWGSGNIENNYDNQITSFNLEDDVYINIRLNYYKNYTNNGGQITSVWANINNNDNLTIVTKVRGISGKVRLKFTNTNDITHPFYSEQAFEIPDEYEHEIFCEIKSNTDWYTGEWKVEIVSTEDFTSSIASHDKIDYYTIRDATGLKGFSTAMNAGAKSQGREFKLIEDISGVGTMAPIAGVSGKAFRGVFEGQEKKISGINIDTSSTYTAFGLFGCVGSDGEIKNLNINGISFKDSSGSYVGGIAGLSDAGAKISNITVENSNINGTNYVGGLIGKCNSSLSECNINNSQVSGTDNVGGVIGYNAGGNISKITNTVSVSGTGENIGGILGCNIGGDITYCNNGGTVSGTGKNVGGIVGCNYNKKIEQCYNNNTVTGYSNVGGIAGITYNGWIDYCGNKSQVAGTGNQVESLTDITYYDIMNEYATGTGGIVGKIHNATVSHSYNIANVICNFNGGGIAGLNAGSTIKYCYNDAEITNAGYRGQYTYREEIYGIVLIEEDVALNRMGGICGAGFGVTITGCYNLGDVNGESSARNTPLGSATGGIIGFLVADTSWIGSKSYRLKYIDLEIKYLDLISSTNSISYCYNTGIIKGHYEGNIFGSPWLWYNGAIVGYVAISINISETETNEGGQFINNYYLEGSSKSGGGRNGKNENGMYQPLSTENLKKQLYTWAAKANGEGGIFNGGDHIYRTTAPLKDELGYDGYGILWWQLDNHVKLQTYIASTDTTKVVNGSNTKFHIGESEPLKIKELDDIVNIEEYEGKDLHCWICYIPKETNVNIKATATYYDDSETRLVNADTDRTELLLVGGRSDSVILYPAGDGSIDWERTRVFYKESEKNLVYRTVWGVRTWRRTYWGDATVPVIGRWNASSKGEVKSTFTKESMTNLDKSFGYVKLKADSRAKFNLDNYNITVNTWHANGASAPLQIESSTPETISGESVTQTGVNAGVKVTIPIEDIVEKSRTNDYPFNRSTSKITYGKAVVNLVYFHHEKKSNLPGISPTDPIIISVKFGSASEQQRTDLKWDWYSSKEECHAVSFEFEFDETNEIPENITIDFEWGADTEAMHFGIDNAYVEVSYKQ